MGFGRRRKRFLEVGCGVGNAFLPVMAANPGLDGCAIDFAKSGIDLLRHKPEFQRLVRERGPGNCSVHVCDITRDPLPAEAFYDGGCDCVLLLYCLSALAPAAMASAVLKVRSFAGNILSRHAVPTRLWTVYGESTHPMRRCVS